MTGFTRTFNLDRMRSAQGVIEDASGWTGRWPFRRAVSFHVGVNCDAISLNDGRLHVRRRGRVIAVAGFPGAGRRFGWAAPLFHGR